MSRLEMASGVELRTIAVHGVNERAGVHQLSTVGATPEGGEFELAFQLGYLVANGTITRFEFFDDDSLEDARSRVAALAESADR